ncbi:metal ABC transporter solute-binding protein, Zn/Mn family [Prauserella muralis]|uniref:Metal ABC transporter substrate-binding protein n=1 Tax=Prauserella muralis TaxID=588067 RepID=A0A2V4B7D7_9PSEU|nr:zinc ABC transporter substrate-binding protein [Prauserella muralis]PXY31147.1 metal ABC transporter substrate-binding protein [Prauserella muralis]TWE14560.1 zinc/manganese transport system substrate-binding protein [Prauserella muralis]
MRASRARRLFPVVATAAVTALALAACGGGDGGESGGQSGGEGKIQVVASTNVWGSVVSAVGGDRVAVKSIIDDPSGDPHSYEASAEDAADAQSAQLLVYNGGGYDEFFGQLAEQAPDARKVVAFDLSGKGDDAGEGHSEESPESHESHAEEGHADEGGHGHEHGEVNEHVWYDLHTVEQVADAVATRLGEADPQGRQAYTANAESFKTELAQLETRISDIGTRHPDSRVVATEPVAHYLLEAAKVTDATPRDFAEAVENETDVPVAAQQEMLELVSGRKVDAVVNNVQTVTPATEKVIGEARGAGLAVVDVTETLPEGTTGYIAWMSGQVDALAGALSK